MQTRAWFALYVSHRAEFKVEESLRELGHEVWCPAWTVWSKARRDERTRAPLYPGYLFVGLGLDRHGDYPFPEVRAIEGVVGILGASGAPIAVPYDAPEPETMMERGAKDPEEPFSIARWLERERAGEFDLTRDSRRKAKKATVQLLRSFQELADALTAMEAA